MLTLYFNRSFSATSYLISSLKSSWSEDTLRIIISHGSEDPYLKEVADDFILEPNLEGESYAQFILKTCKEYGVNVFFPRKQATLLSSYSAEFDSLGIKVAFVGNSDVYSLFDHKLNASLRLKALGLAHIPECALVSDYHSFVREYQRIRSTRLQHDHHRSETVCLKPNVGIGGKGFMRISHYRSEEEDLFRESLHSISFKRLDQGLSRLGSFSELLLATYLSGEEVSVDCISYRGHLIAAFPRVYLNKYEQRFDEITELIDTCRGICQAFGLSYLFNVQFKRHHGEWYFIELNTRSAAGAHRIVALGISPLKIALKLCLGQQIEQGLDIEWGRIIRRIEQYSPM